MLINHIRIDESTTIGEISNEMSGYNLYVMPETAGAWGGMIYDPDRNIIIDKDFDTSTDTVTIPDWLFDPSFNYKAQLFTLFPGLRTVATTLNSIILLLY